MSENPSLLITHHSSLITAPRMPNKAAQLYQLLRSTRRERAGAQTSASSRLDAPLAPRSPLGGPEELRGARAPVTGTAAAARAYDVVETGDAMRQASHAREVSR